MPDVCASRWPTVALASMSSSWSPSTLRTVVSGASDPSATRDMIVSAVKPFDPLAMPKRVVRVLAAPWARSAMPAARS